MNPEDIFLKGTLDNIHERQELREMAGELARRKQEALRLYRPSPLQDGFHKDPAKIRIIQAANQFGKAVRWSTPVLTPTGWSKIDDLRVGDLVIGGDGRPTKVTGVFPQGTVQLYRVAFDDGVHVDCCAEHLWVCRIGERERFKRNRSWRVHSTREIAKSYPAKRPINRADIPLVSPVHGDLPPTVDPYTLGYLIGDGSLSQTSVQFTTGDPEVTQWIHHPGCVVRKLGGRFNYSITRPGYSNPLKAELVEMGLMGCRSENKFIPERCFRWPVIDRLSLLQGLMDSDGCVGKAGNMEFNSVSRKLTDGVVSLVQSLGGKCKVTWRVTKCNGKKGQPSSRVAIVLPSLNPFRLTRKAKRYRDISRNRSRIIYSVDKIDCDEAVCITVDNEDKTYVLENYVVTHNSLACFAELARAVTGQDPYEKYPKSNGIAAVLGMDEKHIGRVVHSYLFKSARFRIIRDEDTGEWRSWEPWRPSDVERKSESRPAGPLIPERFVKKIAWNKRSSNIFDQVEFHNGWILYAMSSKGEPAGGYQADLVLIDEDIERPEWYDEMVARLSMRDGRLVWSALPLDKNDAMVNAKDQAEKEADLENPTVRFFTATIYDNPFMEQKVKDENVRAWKAQGEDVYRRRALGEMVTDSILMYPTFSTQIHSAIKHDGGNKVQEYLTERMGEPGPDWARYMVVDPGHSVCAVTFWAVPPPEKFGDYRICYDELYIQNCTASLFGEGVQMKAKDRHFEAFIIDAHGGRLRDISTGITPRQQYEAQLRDRGIESEQTGYRFIDGSDNIEGRENKLREWLAVRPDGSPTLYIVTQKCPKFVGEFARFRRKIIKGVVQDEGNRRGMCHAIETAEYGAAHGMPYVRPKPKRTNSSVVSRILADRKARAKKRKYSIFTPKQKSGVTLGPNGGSDG